MLFEGSKRGENPIIGSVTYQDKIATFTPDNNLNGSTYFTAKIYSYKVQDVSGNHMAEHYIWRFRTRPDPDTTAPSVIQEYPVDMSACSDIDITITVIFSEEMDVATINTDSFTLTDSSGNPINGRVLTYDKIKSVFIPYDYLSYSESYLATVTSAAKDLSGNNI